MYIGLGIMQAVGDLGQSSCCEWLVCKPDCSELKSECKVRQ